MTTTLAQHKAALAAKADEVSAAIVTLDDATQFASTVRGRIAEGDATVTSRDLSTADSEVEFAELRLVAARRGHETLKLAVDAAIVTEAASAFEAAEPARLSAIAIAARSSLAALNELSAAVDARNAAVADLVKVPQHHGSVSGVLEAAGYKGSTARLRSAAVRTITPDCLAEYARRTSVLRAELEALAALA